MYDIYICMVRYVVWNFPAKKGKILVTFFSRWGEAPGIFFSLPFISSRDGLAAPDRPRPSCRAGSACTQVGAAQKNQRLRDWFRPLLQANAMGVNLTCCCGIVVEHGCSSCGGSALGDDSRGSRRGGEKFIFYEFPLLLVSWERGRHSSSCRL
ncbi:unnamed protein product, partial [Ectocarpus sp. 12 AP-2014]